VVNLPGIYQLKEKIMETLKRPITITKDRLDVSQILLDFELEKIIVTGRLGKADNQGKLIEGEQVVYTVRGEGFQAIADDVIKNGIPAARNALKTALEEKYGLGKGSL
jgi:hypothetical protein